MTRQTFAAVALPLALVATIALVHAPARDGYFLLDDYIMLAFARLLDAPAALFTQDSMPGGGGFYFRPLTLFVWWLTANAGLTSPWSQHVCNFVLHAGVAVLLYAVIRGARVGRGAAFAGAALFALHPIGIGATAWLSDRFDLVAALCGLAALRAAQRFVAAPSPLVGVLALTALAGALLGKEIGLVFVPALALVALGLPTLRGRALAIAAIGAVSLAWLAWRGHVLADDREYTLYTVSALPALVLDGLRKYFAGLVTIGGFTARQSTIALVVAALAAVGTLAAIGSAARDVVAATRERLTFCAAALALVVAPAIVQAPGLDMMQFAIARGTGAFDVVYKMRFFYVGALGIAMLAAVAIDAALQRVAARRVLAVALSLLVAVYAVAAHRLAAQLRNFSNGAPRALAEGAAQAVERLALDGKAPCHVFLLGAADTHGEWPGFADSIVKAVVPSARRVFDCTFQADAAPWMHNLPAATPLERYAPLSPLAENGKAVRTLTIGGLAFRYFNLLPGTDAASVPGARYLAWNGSGFDDVTGDVVAGRRAVAFRCVRSPAQCEPSATPPSDASTPHPASDRTH